MSYTRDIEGLSLCLQIFRVKNVQQLQMDIRAGIMRGRVHITQVLDKPLKVCMYVLYTPIHAYTQAHTHTQTLHTHGHMHANESK